MCNVCVFVCACLHYICVHMWGWPGLLACLRPSLSSLPFCTLDSKSMGIQGIPVHLSHLPVVGSCFSMNSGVWNQVVRLSRPGLLPTELSPWPLFGGLVRRREPGMYILTMYLLYYQVTLTLMTRFSLVTLPLSIAASAITLAGWGRGISCPLQRSQRNQEGRQSPAFRTFLGEAEEQPPSLGRTLEPGLSQAPPIFLQPSKGWLLWAANPLETGRQQKSVFTVFFAPDLMWKQESRWLRTKGAGASAPPRADCGRFSGGSGFHYGVLPSPCTHWDRRACCRSNPPTGKWLLFKILPVS